jgi:hypothetical protein
MPVSASSASPQRPSTPVRPRRPWHDRRRSLAAPLLAVALSGAGATAALSLAAAPAGASAMAPVTVSGTVGHWMGKSEFGLKAGSKHYVVKVDAMTHVKVDGKMGKLADVATGDHVTVKGPLEMGTITATSITVGM